MKTAWEKIFAAPSDSDPHAPSAPLTPAEDEQALKELALAAAKVEQLQNSPEHQRILALVAEKMQRLSQE